MLHKVFTTFTITDFSDVSFVTEKQAMFLNFVKRLHVTSFNVITVTNNGFKLDRSFFFFFTSVRILSPFC